MDMEKFMKFKFEVNIELYPWLSDQKFDSWRDAYVELTDEEPKEPLESVEDFQVAVQTWIDVMEEEDLMDRFGHYVYANDPEIKNVTVKATVTEV
jgi:hypothetical protein